MAMKYKCIIFDCDGVLVDSEGIANKVLINMANEQGANIEMAYALEHFNGRSIKKVLEHIRTLAQKELPTGFEEEFRRRSFEAFKTDLQPIKGIHGLLDKIPTPYCVASSGPPEKIRLNLTVTGLIEKFGNNIFSSYDIGSWKPNPEIFLYAAKSMGFSPHECAVVEDSIAGIQAAKKGGFDVYGYTREEHRTTVENEGAIPFYAMENLYELLDSF